MDLFFFFLGACAGYFVQLAFDHFTYQRSPEYDRALADADRRIKALELELAGARASGSSEGVEIRDSRIHALESQAQESDRMREQLTARIADLETQLHSGVTEEPQALTATSEEDRHRALEAALAEAAARQRALESRLMDVETEIATIRYAPTGHLDRNADPQRLAEALEERERQIATLRLDLERAAQRKEPVAS